MNERTILILLGKRGAGKTSLAKLLERKINFKHVEMSQYLLSLKETLGFKAMVLRKFVEKFMSEKGTTFLISKLVADCVETNKTDVVITGVRHSSEIDFIKTELSEFNISYVYLRVSFVQRFLRILQRKERSSFWLFIIEEYYSIKWGDKYLRSVAFNYKNQKNIEQAFLDLQKIFTNNN